jgi:hypothetical protein
MRYLLLIFLITFYSCEHSVPRIKKKLETVEFSENGKIRKITEYECLKYDVKNDQIDIKKSSCRIVQLREYTSNGILIKDAEWKFNYFPDRPDNLTTCEINELGQKISSNYEAIIGDKIGLTIYEEFEYNDAGFEISKRSYTNGVYTHRNETKYDDYNCPIEEIYFNEDEKRHYNTYEYDRLNRVIKSSFYQYNSLSYYTKYEYDDDNIRYSSSSKYNADDKLIENKKSDSDKPDNVLKENFYENGRIKSKHILDDNGLNIYISFDQNGNLIEHKEFDQEQLVVKKSWEYREDGALLKESQISNVNLSNNSINVTTIYKRDNLGNWTEKVVLNNANEVIDLRIREYEYYF